MVGEIALYNNRRLQYPTFNNGQNNLKIKGIVIEQYKPPGPNRHIQNIPPNIFLKYTQSILQNRSY